MKIMEYLFNCSSLFKINLKWNFLVENCEVLVFSGYNMVLSFFIEQAEEFPIVSLWAGSFLKSEKFLCMLKHQMQMHFPNKWYVLQTLCGKQVF